MADEACVAERKADRQHYWDAARAALMLLGLPYHVAMLYHSGGWIVPGFYTSFALDGLSAFIHLFRMPAFFVVAGYFAALVLARREPLAWLRGRVTRLGPPLLFGLVALVPILNFLGELTTSNARVAAAQWVYQASSSGGYWVRHLWFLIVLLYLSLGAVALAALVPGLARWRLDEGADGRMAQRLPLLLVSIAVAVGLWEALAIEGFWAAGLATNLPQQILRLDDLIAAAPFFLLGALLQRSPRVLEAFGRPSWTLVVLALGATAFGLAFEEHGWPPLGRFAGAVAAIFLTQTLIAATRRFADRPNRAVDRLCAGSFVIYLVHLPILVGLYGVARLDLLPPALGFPAILLLTAGLSWSVWLIVERVPILSLLLNGIVPARERPISPLPAPASG